MGLGFYSAAEAARIAKVPRSTLDYWTRTKLIPASQRSTRPRLYSFEDLRDIVVAEQLRKQGAKTRHTRAALKWVRSEHDVQRLAQASFWVDQGALVYMTDRGLVAPHMRGQRPFKVNMRKVFKQLGSDPSDPLLLRPHKRIQIDPRVRGGTPVIEGTRIPTRLVRELVDDGVTEADILRMYPALTAADIAAAVEWESQQDVRAA
jgi:uncharacterized protein (DUF433 family)/DNA-binding transcriptional MerR regulator